MTNNDKQQTLTNEKKHKQQQITNNKKQQTADKNK